MKTIATMLVLVIVSAFSAEYYDRGKLVKLTPTTQPSTTNARSLSSATWYRTETGETVGTTNCILVKWKNPSQASSVLKSMGITNFSWLTTSMTSAVVPSGKDLFELSRKLSEHVSTEFAHPNFLRERTLR